MCGNMVNIQCAAAEIRRGKKKIEDRKKPQDENIIGCPIPYGDHKKLHSLKQFVRTTMATSHN